MTSRTRLQSATPFYFGIAGITLKVTADLPITRDTFGTPASSFSVAIAGQDIVHLHHLFSLPLDFSRDSAREVWREGPWTIYDDGDHWIYSWGIVTARCTKDYQTWHFYHRDEKAFREGQMTSLTGFTTDQILLAPVLSIRSAAILHSAGFQIGDNGLLCVGASDAGKSTITRWMIPRAEVLCDDRNIIRRFDDGFKVYGTWSHGDVPNVSPGGGKLKAIIFHQKSNHNRLTPLTDRRQIVQKLLDTVIRSYADRAWWENTITLIEQASQEVPCYTLEFDLSGKAADIITELLT